MLKNLSIIIFVVFFSVESFGSDAYVNAEEEIGQGFFRARGSECFFITANHVVENATKIELITPDRLRYKASVITTYPDDVAILRVELPIDTACPKSSWDSGKKLKVLLNMEMEGKVKTLLEDGSFLQTAVVIKAFDSNRYILITPKNSNIQISKSFIGSPLFIADKLAGMLQSVLNGVGYVFRQDTLNNTISLFFNVNQDISIVDTQKNKLNVEKNISTKNLNLPKTYKGKLAKGATLEHQFEAAANSPILFATTGTSLRYQLQIFKGKKELYKTNTYANRSATDVFTPQNDGTYTFRLTGFQGYGDYSLFMEQFTTATKLTSKANVIAPDDTVEGRLAKDATAVYRFEGLANNPVLFTTTGTSLRYEFQIFKGKKELYKTYTYANRSATNSFTPQKNGTYTIRLTGFQGYGDFTLYMEKLIK